MNTYQSKNNVNKKLQYVISFFLLALINLSFNSCTTDEVAMDQKTPSVMESITLPDDVLEKTIYGPEQFIRNNAEPTIDEVQMTSEVFECHRQS